MRISRRAFIGGTVALGSTGGVLVGALGRLNKHSTTSSETPSNTLSFLSPFGFMFSNRLVPIWSLNRRAYLEAPNLLTLLSEGLATGPQIEVQPGAGYRLTLQVLGSITVRLLWENTVGHSVSQQDIEYGKAKGNATFAVPAGVSILRVQILTRNTPATITDPRLTLLNGVRIEPFPYFARAALAFSFDWESAMGGLIHSRSTGGDEGVGTLVGVQPDGAPSIIDAEAKGLRMRDGARYLADLFAQQRIRATFYATGYNLLRGNTEGERFLGNPVYANVDRDHGWSNDFWKTHPWYMHDPFTTEDVDPAWYFGSETIALARAGHEIGSHSFGHLYVRGVSPEQLAADLALWRQSAQALAIPTIPSFAFPWTSSNSVDTNRDYLDVFKAAEMTILTRLYPESLREQYMLSRLEKDPAFIVFPDLYLPSTMAGLDKAFIAIEQTLMRHGYLSLWTHPNETVEQAGRIVWPRVVDYAVAARDRGLWLAPIYEVVRHHLATRLLAVTSLPLNDGVRLIIENRARDKVDGITVTLTRIIRRVADAYGHQKTDFQGQQLCLPQLMAGEKLTLNIQY